MAILLIAVGSLIASGYYVPIRKIKEWSWENYWAAQGVVSWIILPWVVTLSIIPFASVGTVLSAAQGGDMGYAVLFGALWGVGGLTWGLGMRYLGVSLGQSISYGLTAAVGTIIPPIVARENLFAGEGLLILSAVAIALAGIAVIGFAGSLRDKGMTEEEKRKAVKEFAFKKGLLIAIFAGVMSACFNFGLLRGASITEAALAAGAPSLLASIPVHIFVMGGGAIVNLAYCIYLFVKNKSFGQYASVKGCACTNNILFSILGGTMWYTQFFFFGMGQSLLEPGSVLMVISWSILMSMNIVFSNVWGIILKEWAGTSAKTKTVLVGGLVLLLLSVFFPTFF